MTMMRNAARAATRPARPARRLKRHAALLAAAILFGAAATSAPAATLSLVEGKLAGASGVLIGTVSYDVSFVDGTCAQVFGTCQQSSFDFTTDADARAAATALAEQVFLDTIEGSFDSLPELTLGCESPISCAVFIPTEVSAAILAGIVFGNRPTTDSIVRFTVNPAINTDPSGLTGAEFDAAKRQVFARFTTSAAVEVPEPASLAIMLGGLGLLRGARRRNTVRGT